MNPSTPSSPHIHTHATVTRLMLRVLYALIPGIAVYAWLFGWGVLAQIAWAVVIALAAEALMLRLRHRPLKPFLTDGSAVITAVLLALSLPPLAPWWLTLAAVLFAMVIAKHLFGGLGHNPFNPAMAGFVMALVSFPREMTQWAAPLSLSAHDLTLTETLRVIFGGGGPLAVDTYTTATPLDTLKTQLRLDHTVTSIFQSHTTFGTLAGTGWEWVSLAFLAGGLWLVRKRIAAWQIPAGMLGALGLISLIFWLVDSDHYASPLFHLLSGAAMLGAFFIATDPVTAATTPRGRLIYGAGIGLLTYVIRTFGGYPEAVAFGVLLMNLAAPTIDHYTKPRVFGHSK